MTPILNRYQNGREKASATEWIEGNQVVTESRDGEVVTVRDLTPREAEEVSIIPEATPSPSKGKEKEDRSLQLTRTKRIEDEDEEWADEVASPAPPPRPQPRRGSSVIQNLFKRNRAPSIANRGILRPVPVPLPLQSIRFATPVPATPNGSRPSSIRPSTGRSSTGRIDLSMSRTNTGSSIRFQEKV